jgi:hypothetical protein
VAVAVALALRNPLCPCRALDPAKRTTLASDADERSCPAHTCTRTARTRPRPARALRQSRAKKCFMVVMSPAGNPSGGHGPRKSLASTKHLYDRRHRWMLRVLNLDPVRRPAEAILPVPVLRYQAFELRWLRARSLEDRDCVAVIRIDRHKLPAIATQLIQTFFCAPTGFASDQMA